MSTPTVSGVDRRSEEPTCCRVSGLVVCPLGSLTQNTICDLLFHELVTYFVCRTMVCEFCLRLPSGTDTESED